jgi:hypothetical protein
MIITILIAHIVANGMSLTVMFVMNVVLTLPVIFTKLMIKNRRVGIGRPAKASNTMALKQTPQRQPGDQPGVL